MKPSERVDQIIQRENQRRRDTAKALGDEAYRLCQPDEAILIYLDEEYELKKNQNETRRSVSKANTNRKNNIS